MSVKAQTNVDFNSAMLGALGQIRDDESVSLAVGNDEVALIRGAEQVVEKKVKLPIRWIRGMAEVQAYLAQNGASFYSKSRRNDSVLAKYPGLARQSNCLLRGRGGEWIASEQSGGGEIG